MPKLCPSTLYLAFLTGLLSRTPAAASLATLCGASKSTIAAALSTQCYSTAARSIERAAVASEEVYFAFDYTQSLHVGAEMEGLSYSYSSAHKASRLGQRYASMALVHHKELPIPLGLTYAVGKELETAAYRYLTPSQQLIRTVSELKAASVRFKGTLVDAEFGTKDVIRAFVTNDDPLLTRMKSNSRVVLDGQSMTLATLARTYPRSTCHLYSKIGWRVKRVAVEYDGHAVTILIVWRAVNGCWKPFFLLSTFSLETSVGELVSAWKSRWGIEVIHRFLKQNLSLGKCQYRSIVAHQNWADLAVDAFHLILKVRKTWSTMSWKDAQLQAAQISLERVRTALFLDSTHLEAV